ncbi:N-6 DNA methylase [Spirosoma sp. HMF4905]|uniref:site-specific DNA-methyltransferase (adenine-specific) n=1 Tax=Spirosoma arboris TaxID=2682092 RepID=A0A7K1S634_9BACT|nr:N-6 DNA methylase [Spirosoma arboris]MVM29281.1 N-6 DNA methylase [Spirosoma arboris]
MSIFSSLFEQLQFSRDNGLFYTQENRWEGIFPSKIERTLRLLSPTAFFVFNGEPLVLFFDNTYNTSQTHQNCWNFNVTPILFFVSDTDIEIYNSFKLEKKKKQVDSVEKRISLEKLGGKPNIQAFNFWNIASGNVFQTYQSNFNSRERVDRKLLDNIEAARNELLKKGLPSSIANNLLGRLIFIRYLIDRKVRISFDEQDEGFLTSQHFRQILQSRQLLYNLFAHLRQKFKGDVFPGEAQEYLMINDDHLEVLYQLFSGEYVAPRQLSLFNLFNFDIIPVEFISNIYEYFMGREKQVDQKAYYTPSFLANYIVDRTVSTYFEQHPNQHECKVLDPTCGSGIFLVETLRRIINQYERTTAPITNQNSHVLTKLAVDNIFGIDKDPNAISVAIFSLYITLLDYQEPKDIEYFELPDLLNKNFFVEDFFNLNEGSLFEAQSYCASVLKDVAFQFIIGNPPWGEVADSPYMACIREREKKEGTIIGVSDNQFSQAFLVHTSLFCQPETVCAIVINSKLLYNLNAYNFRQYFLKRFHVDSVLELSAVRRYLFNRSQTGKGGAITPAAVLVYRHAKGHATKDNVVTHTTLKLNLFYRVLRLFVIEKNDIKKLKQANFVQYDWIWKVLLYGNALDFQFIKRLRSNEFSSIGDVVDDENQYEVGVGVTMGGKDKNPASHLVDKPYLDLTKGYIQPFHVNIPNNSTWKKHFVHRPSNASLFQPPMLLLQKSVDSHFRAKAAVSYKPVVFTDNVISIKLKQDDLKSASFLHELEGLFHSRLFTYFQLHTAASIGVEREKAMKKELLSFPYRTNTEVGKIAKKIEEEINGLTSPINLYNLLVEGANLFTSIEQYNTLHQLYRELNVSIEEAYDVNSIESALIDYAETVTIPQHISTQQIVYPASDTCLENYLSVFRQHFEKVFPVRKGYKFIASAHREKYFVQASFNISIIEPGIPDTSPTEEDIRKRIDLFSRLSLSKFSDQLFIQKDIKLFEKTSFHIIKPNEDKNWHLAIAYSDLFEIRESLLNSMSNPSTPVNEYR